MNKRQYKKFVKKNYCKRYDRMYKEINDAFDRALERQFDPIISALPFIIPESVINHINYINKRYK